MIVEQAMVPRRVLHTITTSRSPLELLSIHAGGHCS